MSETFDYSGRDLEAMFWAVNYHRWILQKFERYLGTKVVEVGAGTGSFSELLLECQIESLSLVEPSPSMYAQLSQRMRETNTSTEITTYPTTFEHAAEQIHKTQHPDSIVYVNVLEHIADDNAELQMMNRTLNEGGRIFIFVPAFSWLFGPFDKRIGHHRRYTRKQLSEKCATAGFKIIEAQYFDLLGIVPWWIKYRVLKSDQLEPASVKVYDRYIVPIARRVENALDPPVGKNLIVIAEKIIA